MREHRAAQISAETSQHEQEDPIRYGAFCKQTRSCKARLLTTSTTASRGPCFQNQISIDTRSPTQGPQQFLRLHRCLPWGAVRALPGSCIPPAALRAPAGVTQPEGSAAPRPCLHTAGCRGARCSSAAHRSPVCPVRSVPEASKAGKKGQIPLSSLDSICHWKEIAGFVSGMCWFKWARTKTSFCDSGKQVLGKVLYLCVNILLALQWLMG